MDTISEFLAKSLSQKAVSLIIVDSAKVVQSAIEELVSNGFAPFNKVGDLERGGKYYFVVDSANAKKAYDLACEYGTGQVTCFNSATGAPAWTTPTYDKSSFVFVVIKDDLASIEGNGLPLCATAGIAFQFA